jgi:predicted Zn-dependent protease
MQLGGVDMTFKRGCVCAIAILLLLAGALQAQNESLPDFGESGVLPMGQEYVLGRAWLMSFRHQVPVVNDPILQDYLETLVYRLAEFSELKDRRLEVIIIDNPSINAFAVPGGVVGVHNGLIAKAQSEAQLASVLTHELAHISQRHFSRGVENQQATSMPSMAGMLGGLVMVAAGAGDAGIATIMGTAAAAQQTKLRHSRLHEQEADRIGIQNLERAGMDPNGAAAMFDVMQAGKRNYGGRPPEFLLTHPLTESRIADARNRARTYEQRVYEDNPAFQLMKARVALHFIEENDKAVAHFRQQLSKRGRHAEADQYGLVLALTRAGNPREAMMLLKPLREFSPQNMIYALAEVDIELVAGNYKRAFEILERGMLLVPGNHPITMSMVAALVQVKEYRKAETILAAHALARPDDPLVWYELAEIQGQAGNTLGVHQSRAEYFVLHGQLQQAQQQLGYARPMADNDITVARIDERIHHIGEMRRALKQL